ncbi:unnamed protein product [Paramecium pentaurelia]|uniref:Uncharacterized protein n=1 Tax=Paramecium pentaurelia TaxID=43138 RepID=A0A8S1YMF2_9CILI|nr:unnamed protein product [Paramecium pentaurelia]
MQILNAIKILLYLPKIIDLICKIQKKQKSVLISLMFSLEVVKQVELELVSGIILQMESQCLGEIIIIVVKMLEYGQNLIRIMKKSKIKSLNDKSYNIFRRIQREYQSRNMEYITQRINYVLSKLIQVKEEDSIMKKDKNKECGQKYKIKQPRRINMINISFLLFYKGNYKKGRRVNYWKWTLDNKTIGYGEYNENGYKDKFWPEVDKNYSNRQENKFQKKLQTQILRIIQKWNENKEMENISQYIYFVHDRIKLLVVEGYILMNSKKMEFGVNQLKILVHNKFYNQFSNLIFQVGAYSQDIKVGQWKIHIDNSRIGGGKYDKSGLKQGDWIDGNAIVWILQKWSQNIIMEIQIRELIIVILIEILIIQVNACIIKSDKNKIIGQIFLNVMMKIKQNLKETIKKVKDTDYGKLYKKTKQQIWTLERVASKIFINVSQRFKQGSINDERRISKWSQNQILANSNLKGELINQCNSLYSIKSGCGSFNEKGQKIGKWRELHSYYPLDREVISCGSYVDGLKVGIREDIKLDQILIYSHFDKEGKGQKFKSEDLFFYFNK